MDYCLLCRRIKEFSGFSVNDFSFKVLHCGTTYYSRIINHEIEPKDFQINYLYDFLANYICNKNNDPLLDELYKIEFIALKLEQTFKKSPKLTSELFEQLDSELLFEFINEMICVIQKRRDKKYQNEILEKIIKLIGNKNIDLELVKNELKKLTLSHR